MLRNRWDSALSTGTARHAACYLEIDRAASRGTPRAGSERYVSKNTRALARPCGNLNPARSCGPAFAEERHFWGQISATIDTLRAADPGNEALVPVDLVTSSASGLDPDSSPASAEYRAGHR